MKPKPTAAAAAARLPKRAVSFHEVLAELLFCTSRADAKQTLDRLKPGRAVAERLAAELLEREHDYANIATNWTTQNHPPKGPRGRVAPQRGETAVYNVIDECMGRLSMTAYRELWEQTQRFYACYQEDHVVVLFNAPAEGRTSVLVDLPSDLAARLPENALTVLARRWAALPAPERAAALREPS
jgi:hypothetical protein